jgi:cytochrome c553
MTLIARATTVASFQVSLGLVALTFAAAPGYADEAKRLSFGKHLAQECSSCHRIDGIDNGIPSIIAWNRDEFVTTLKFYRDGQRPNPAMVSVAQSLDDEQMMALAAYYGALPKPERKAAPAAVPATKTAGAKK